MPSYFEEPRVHGELQEGEVFEGRFQIISVIGKGGVGVVYKAKQAHINK